MANVLLGIGLWGLAALLILARQHGRKIATKYNLQPAWLFSLPSILPFLLVVAGAAAVALGIRGV